MNIKPNLKLNLNPQPKQHRNTDHKNTDHNKNQNKTSFKNTAKHSDFRKINNLLTFCLALTLLGFAIVCQINFESNSLQNLENQSTETLVAMVRNLNDYRSNLDTELERLERSKSSLNLTTGLQQQLQNTRIFAGATPVSGPGISVTITADYEVISTDIVDITSELKVSGAEAIAVNNQRLTAKTRISQDVDQDGNIFLSFNGERLLTPIVITAIGDPTTLEKGLTFTGGIIDSLNTLYSIYPIIRQEENIDIPATTLNTSPSYRKYDANSTQPA